MLGIIIVLVNFPDYDVRNPLNSGDQVTSRGIRKISFDSMLSQQENVVRVKK